MDEFENMLHDLLAVLHRDGGHYTAEVGLEKSIHDAKLKFLKLVHNKEAIPSTNERILGVQ